MRHDPDQEADGDAGSADEIEPADHKRAPEWKVMTDSSERLSSTRP
jgi:hypothetical protein